MPKRDLTTRLADVEAQLKRWHTRLARASTIVSKLEKQRRRLMLEQASEGQPVIATVRVKKARTETCTFPQVEFEEDKTAPPIPQEILDRLAKTDDDIPTFLKRDPNADALKAMNRRIEERAAERSKKPPKAKPPSRLLAKAMAEAEARDKK